MSASRRVIPAIPAGTTVAAIRRGTGSGNDVAGAAVRTAPSLRTTGTAITAAATEGWRATREIGHRASGAASTPGTTGTGVTPVTASSIPAATAAVGGASPTTDASITTDSGVTANATRDTAT